MRFFFVLPFGLGLLCAQQVFAQAPGRIIQTYAGADWTFQADGKPAINAPLGQIFGVVADSNGNIYAADGDNNLVVKIAPNGTLTVVAGNGIAGSSGDGGDARSASLNQPESVALGPDGSLYIGDYSQIHRVTPDGIIHTIAGGGGSSADGVPASSAAMFFPLGIIFDASGNLYFSDSGSHRVRKISPAGVITTVAGNGQAGFSGDGGPAVNAMLKNPYGLRFDAAGNLLIADSENSRIRKVDTKGIITTFAGGGSSGGDGIPAAQAQLVIPSPIDFDSAGNLYLLETVSGRVRRISPSGIITTLAGPGPGLGFSGDGGPASSASFFFARGLAVDRSGNVLIGDTGNRRVRRFAPGGIINTVAGNYLYRFSPDGTQATLAFLKRPSRVSVNPVNNLVYYVDRDDFRVRRVNADGSITTVAGNGNGTPSSSNGPIPATSIGIGDLYGVAFDSQGNLYITDAQRIRRITPDGTLTTYAGGGAADPGDGGAATAAALNQPRDLAFDASNNLYLTEFSGRVRKVTPAGILSTIAGNGTAGFSGDGGPAVQAQLNSPDGIVVDPAGNLYVADSGNNRVRKITAGGVISTFVGGGGSSANGVPAAQAALRYPIGLALDTAGNLYIGDTFNQKVRVVTTDGSIATLAGAGGTGFSGDGGPAQLAKFGFSAAPSTAGVAVDSSGNVYVADAENFRIRVIPAGAPTFSVSPGSVSFTVNAGDAPPAVQQIAVSSSALGLPYSLAVNGSFITATASGPTTPATVSVTVNPAALTPGTYSGTITFTPAVGGIAPASVDVSVTVQPAAPSILAVDTQGLAFSLSRGGAPSVKTIQVRNNGSGTVNFSASTRTNTGGAWLSVAPASGSATPSAPVTLQVTADPKSLDAGTYSGVVNITDAAGSKSVSIPVNLTVSASGQLIRLSQSGLSFAGVVNAGVSPPQNVVVLNGGQGSFQFNAAVKYAAPPGGWLAVTPASGTSDASKPFRSLSVSVNPAGLGAGDYFGRIDVTSPTADNSPQYLTIALHVFPEGTDPGPFVQPSGLVFTGVAGGGDPGSQTVQVINLAAAPVSFGSGLATLDGGKYVAYQPSFASVPTGSIQLVVQPTLAGLSAGIYRGAITLVFSDGGIQTVAILIVLAPPGTVLGSDNQGAASASGCTPTKLVPLLTSLGANFAVPAGFPTALQARVVDDCASPAASGSLVSSFSNGDAPLSLIALGDGNWSATWVSRNNAQRQVTITGTADLPLPQLHGSVQVTGGLSGDAAVPVIGSGGITSASSFAPRVPLAPGAMVSIFGSHLGNGSTLAPSLPLGTQLAGATLVVAGQAMPLLYASDGQINAVMPFSVPVNTPVQVVAANGSQVSVPEEITIAAAQPGVFTLDGSGRGQGHIYVAAADGSSHLAGSASPAKAGDELVIYCSGLGAVDQPVADGAASPLAPIARAVNVPAVTISGVNARVDFAGLTPGFAGLYQINVNVPAGVPAGSSVPLVITSAGQSSPSTVTLAVQ